MPLVDAEKKRYEDLFNEMDLDNSKSLSVKEMVKLIRAMGWDRSKFPNTEIYKWFKDIDEDGDSKVDLKEFLDACDKRPRSEVDEANLRRTLTELDSSGKVTADQVKEALKTCNIDLKEETDPVLAKADKTADGKIDAEEFITLVSFSTMISKEAVP